VFSGQGSQWIGMGQELLAQEPVFRAAIEECDRLMRPHVSWSLLEEVTRPNEESRLNDTEIAQPAIFAFQVGLTALWRSWGMKPSAVVGHSVGEIAAAYVSGAISLADACRIITHRGRLMQGATGKGKMLATRLDTEAARQAIVGYEDRLAVAVNNSPISTVLSGDPAALQEVQARLEQQGVSVRMLRVNYAFHSYQVTEYGEQLKELLSGEGANQAVRPTASVIPMYSTVTGQVIEGQELTADYWRRNIQEPVLFGNAITTLAELGYSHYVEVSPHPVLSGNVAECLQPLGREAVAVSSLRREQPERPEMLGSLATLYQLGYTIEWRTFFPQGGQLVKLPLYPWQRQRYWLEPVEVAGGKWQVAQAAGLPGAGGRRGRGLLGERVRLARPGGDVIWENVIGRPSLPYLADHRFQGAVVLSGAVYVSMALAAAAELYSVQPHGLKGIEFHKALFLHENEQRLAQVIVSPAAGHDAPFYVYSQGADEEWALHAAGHVNLQTPVSGPGANGFKPGNSHLTLSVRDAQARCPAEMTGEAYYAALRPFGFDYGPAFQGLERVWHGDQETLALVRVPESLATEVGSYRFHPAVLDSALQAAWPVLLDLAQGNDGKGASYIPTRIGRVQLHSQPNQLLKLWSHAVRQVGHVSNLTDSGDKVDVDVRLYDEMGLLVAEVTGITFERLALQIPAAPPSAAAQLRSSAIIARVTAAGPDERLEMLESYLKQEVAKVTRLSVSRLDAGQPLTRLGLDSLMAVELKNRIEGDLGVEVPLVAFLEGVSIAELSSQVADGIESAPAMAAAELLDVAELWEMEDWDGLLASIERMTAEDLDFLLAELRVEG
ncbi:MAG: acyltransferase domain-containing protein, partial [Chloroflexota bacterium]